MALTKSETGLIDEMSIVDVFTRLIFDPDTALDDTELLVLEYLADVDNSLVNAPRRDISELLRSMGVDEMITVVARVKRMLDHQQGLIAASRVNSRSHLHR